MLRKIAFLAALVAVCAGFSGCGNSSRDSVAGTVSAPGALASGSSGPEAPLSYEGQRLVPEVVLPVGKSCRRPRRIVAAPLPTAYEVQGDALLQAILSGARQAFGGVIAPLTPELPHAPIGVRLRLSDHVMQAELSVDRGFSSGQYREFGFAEVPIIPVAAGGMNVGEALAIPFASPADAARFENRYIQRSCASEFIPPPARSGTQAAIGAPAVTPDNLVGLAIQLPRATFDRPDLVVEDAVIGRYIIHIQIYATFQELTEAQLSAPFALAYALSSAGITYHRCDPSGVHCANLGPNSTLLASI